MGPSAQTLKQRSMNGSIPRRIIQTDKHADQPLLGRGVAANLRLLNPDFDYVFFDDVAVDRFIDTEFPQYRALFEYFPFRIQRYDFFRYLAVYHLGGFYFDTDVLLASALDDLLPLGCVFPFEELTGQTFLVREYDMDWEIGNYAFGAAANHPFIGAIIDNCVRAQREPAWAQQMMRPVPAPFRNEFQVLDTTGPGLVSRTLAEFPGAANHVHVPFPDDVRDVSTWHRFGNYGVHLQNGSWRRRRNAFYRMAFGLWDARTRRSLQTGSVKRGPKRTLQFRRAE